jgi:chromosomal replication initiator protein
MTAPSLQTAEQLWNTCLEEIKKDLPRQSFETWLKPTRALSLDEQGLVVEVHHRVFSDWIEERYTQAISEILARVSGHALTVRFQVRDKDAQPPTPALVTTPLTEEKTPRPHTANQGREQLNPRYTFDTFVIGASNQFAHAAALAVAEAPGKTAFNPLFIYSDVGLGKTHLLQAIGHFALEEETARRVVYISTEQFTSDFIDSIQKHKSSDFSNYYRTTDILLIDDIQFLTGKKETQEAFFHTFNTLHQNGKQIVLTSDRPPKELNGLEERLISRFKWGLTVDIQAPDLETRIAILKKKAAQESVAMPDEIFYYIANNIDTSIRELEGAYIKVAGYARLTQQTMTLEMAQQVIRDMVATKKKFISIEFVQKVVSDYLNIQDDKMRAKVRKKEIAIARQVAMYLAKQFTNSSLKTIGLHFGGRDHSTVIHAIKIVEEKSKQDPSFNDMLEKISQIINQSKE